MFIGYLIQEDVMGQKISEVKRNDKRSKISKRFGKLFVFIIVSSPPFSLSENSNVIRGKTRRRGKSIIAAPYFFFVTSLFLFCKLADQNKRC